VRFGSVIRRRELVALLLAETVSTTGTQMTWLALPWFVLTTSGSASRMAFVMAAEAIGVAAFGLPGGALISRAGARRAMLAADAARAPLMLAVPVLYWAHALSYPLLLVLVFACGAFVGPHFAAQRVILPELLGEDERAVTQASSFFQAATRITLLLGPAVAGVLIAAVGAPSVIVIDAITYAVSFTIVAALVPKRPVAPQAEEARGIGAGFRFILGDPLLRGWLPSFVAGDAAFAAFFAAVPVLVVDAYGADPRVAGWVFASFGVGAVIGNVGSLRLAQRYDSLTIVTALVFGQALPLWFLVGRLPAFAVALVVFASGLFNGLVNPAIHGLMTLRAPPALRAKAMAAGTTLIMVAQPIGLAIAAPVLGAFGAHPVLVAFAVTQTAAMGAVALVGRRVRGAARVPAEAL
jgi:MFS family permease